MQRNNNNTNKGNFLTRNINPNMSIEPKHSYKPKAKNFINNSVRMPTMTNGFNSTFRFDKVAMTSSSTSQSTNKKAFNEYVYDLENTYKINHELVTTLIQTSMTLSQPQKRSLMKAFDFIENCFNKKKANRIEKQKLASKILINKQIIEEAKRRNDETYLYFKDQLEDYKENIGKKKASIKQFHKKFNEVEVFVQREARNNLKTYGRYSSFLIVPFIVSNETIVKLRNKRQKEYKEKKLRNQLMSNEVNDIRLKYKNDKKGLIEIAENGLIYIQRRNEYLKGLLICFTNQRYVYRRNRCNHNQEGKDNKDINNINGIGNGICNGGDVNINGIENSNGNANGDNMAYDDKRLLTMDCNVIEKQITEISVIEDEKNNNNKYEMLETENVNYDIKESNC